MVNRSRAKQWSRAAWALAVLFASLPLAGKLLMGGWGFPGAAEIAFLCLAVGTYLHFLGRRDYRAAKDDALMLEEALRLAASGETDAAIVVLTNAIRRSPRLWQAYQYRGELRLPQRDACDRALADFTEAIRLAPKEPHLYALRAQARILMGDERSAQEDAEMAEALRAGPDRRVSG